MDNTDNSGVLIRDILGSSLAELNGFQLNDVVQEINGKVVRTRTEIFDQLTSRNHQKITAIKVLRSGKAELLEVRL